MEPFEGIEMEQPGWVGEPLFLKRKGAKSGKR